MKAIRIAEYGGPEVLQRVEVPIPKPEPGTVLVQLAFAGINFMDVHTRQGKYENSHSYPIALPITLGMEGAGIVRALGAGVGRFAPGDRVAWCISWGSYADFAVVPVARLANIPDEISFDLAAAAIFQGSTAHYLINEAAHLGAGMTCLVHAASGAIGRLLVQLARRRGAVVYATASSDEKAAVARALGASEVFRYEDGQFADAVRESTAGSGVDVVFDAVGAPTLRDSFRAARTRGLVVNYGSVGGAVKDLDPIELGEAGSLYLTRPRLIDYLEDAETVQRRADDVFAGLMDGSISVEIPREYAFEELQEAHAALEERRQMGKAVLKL
ncbi:MAG: zinc-binding alcohol dehydrogenase [Acidimicrobiaceae bacterium]|nr:zinc-binding alcohol dehydrogenase [Acidimicrobiaceae bacterium]